MLRSLVGSEMCIRDRIWNDQLGRIKIEGGTPDQQRTFYSCLYRTLLFPRKFYEINEKDEIVHYSPYNGEVLPGYMFTDNGFWDTCLLYTSDAPDDLLCVDFGGRRIIKKQSH